MIWFLANWVVAKAYSVSMIVLRDAVVLADTLVKLSAAYAI